MRLLYPQEIEVFYLIPAVRKEFAVQLKKQGKEQREIAKLLGVTEAAISQYLNEKRATEIKLDRIIISKIKKSTKKVKSPIDIVGEIQEILAFIRQTRLICKYHHRFMKGIPKDCYVCFGYVKSRINKDRQK